MAENRRKEEEHGEVGHSQQAVLDTHIEKIASGEDEESTEEGVGKK